LGPNGIGSPESREAALSYARVILGEVLIKNLMEHAIQGVLTSLYRVNQRLLALARAACLDGVRQVVDESAVQLGRVLGV
jgi:hypothetical protein